MEQITSSAHNNKPKLFYERDALGLWFDVKSDVAKILTMENINLGRSFITSSFH